MLILDDEKRKSKRQAEPLTARIEVRMDRLITWDEVTPLIDFSALGAGFILRRGIKPGRLILLTTSMPREFRGFDFSKTDYKVWGIVRRCIKMNGCDGEDRFSIGVAFIGKTPPSEHLDNPNALCELSDDKPRNGFWQVSTSVTNQENGASYAKQRRHSRYEIPEEVTLELMDENGWALASETAVTLNLSANGAAVHSQLNAAVGSVVRVSSSRNNVRLISIVRAKHTGQSGLSRINLEFIDQPFPLDLSSGA
jgi:hypothetical protein